MVKCLAAFSASKGDLQPGPQGRLWGDGNAAACKLLRMEVDLPPLYGSYVKRKLGQCYDLVSQRLRGGGLPYNSPPKLQFD